MTPRRRRTDRRLPVRSEVVTTTTDRRRSRRRAAAPRRWILGARRRPPGSGAGSPPSTTRRSRSSTARPRSCFFVVGGIEALLIRLQLARPERHGAHRRRSTTALHDARHDDGVPRGHAARGRVRQLLRAADDRRPRRRVPAPQHVRLLGRSSFGGLFIYSGFVLGGAPERRLVRLRAAHEHAARRTGFLPGHGPDFWAVGVDHARHRVGRDRRSTSSSPSSTCARPA